MQRSCSTSRLRCTATRETDDKDATTVHRPLRRFRYLKETMLSVEARNAAMPLLHRIRPTSGGATSGIEIPVQKVTVLGVQYVLREIAEEPLATYDQLNKGYKYYHYVNRYCVNSIKHIVVSFCRTVTPYWSKHSNSQKHHHDARKKTA